MAPLRLLSQCTLHDTSLAAGGCQCRGFPLSFAFPKWLEGTVPLDPAPQGPGCRLAVPLESFPAAVSAPAGAGTWVCVASELPCGNPHVKCREKQGASPHSSLSQWQRRERVNHSFCHHSPNPPQGTRPEVSGVNRERFPRNINQSQSRRSGSG